MHIVMFLSFVSCEPNQTNKSTLAIQALKKVLAQIPYALLDSIKTISTAKDCCTLSRNSKDGGKNAVDMWVNVLIPFFVCRSDMTMVCKGMKFHRFPLDEHICYLKLTSCEYHIPIIFVTS